MGILLDRMVNLSFHRVVLCTSSSLGILRTGCRESRRFQFICRLSTSNPPRWIVNLKVFLCPILNCRRGRQCRESECCIAGLCGSVPAEGTSFVGVVGGL